MVRGNLTLPVRFFKIILQTNLQKIKIPNNFTRSYGVGLSNPVFIKPPDGTKWKVYWKNINGEIWLEKGWKKFTENYSLQQGCLVVFKYEGVSTFDVLILHQNAVEIDYSSCDTFDENINLAHSDDDSIEILDEWPKQKTRQKSPLVSPRPLKKVRGETEKTAKRTSSLNWPKGARAQEISKKFMSCNPFFTRLVKPINMVENRLYVPNLKGIIENKEKNVMLQIGKRSWNMKLLRFRRTNGRNNGRRFSSGWSLFARQSGLQPGDVCVFELINKNDVVFKVHVFKRDS